MMVKKRTTRKAARKTTTTPAVSPLQHSWQQTSVLVHRLMAILEAGIAEPEHLPEHWERVFGTKDSAVVSLQKLVAVLAEISEHVERTMQTAGEEEAPGELSPDDLTMIQRWVEEELGKCDDSMLR